MKALSGRPGSFNVASHCHGCRQYCVLCTVPEGSSVLWGGGVCLGGSRPDASDNPPIPHLFLVFQVVLSPRTHWDHLPLMPRDVPCVVKLGRLGPPQRATARTQPPLVGTGLRLLPQLCQWGLGAHVGCAGRLLPHPPPVWSTLGRGFASQIRALPAQPAQCPALTGQALGGTSSLC